VEFVLGHWTEAEWGRIATLDAPFARFLDLLDGAEALDTLANQVNPAGFWDQAGDQRAPIDLA
jgi:hypothetical protein